MCVCELKQPAQVKSINALASDTTHVHMCKCMNKHVYIHTYVPEAEKGHFNRGGGTSVFATHVVMFKRIQKALAHTIFQLFGLFLVNV